MPQGSILGPLFFILYINDLPNICNLDVRLFADDACLLFSSKDPKEIEDIVNEELFKIGTWLKLNKLTVNYSKSNFMLFQRKRSNTEICIKMDENLLERVKEVKYLGVILDENLNWKSHIKYLTSKIARASYILSKLRHYVCFSTLKMVYFSLVHPYLSYCISSWGGISKTTLLPLFRLQKKLLGLLLLFIMICMRGVFFRN